MSYDNTMTTTPQADPIPLLHQRDALLREIRSLAKSNLMRGSLSVVGRKCGKPTCFCATEDRRHPARYLSVKQDGKTRLLYVSEQQEAELRMALHRCHRLMAVVDELTQVNLQLLEQSRPRRKQTDKQS